MANILNLYQIIRIFAGVLIPKEIHYKRVTLSAAEGFIIQSASASLSMIC